MKPEIKHLWIDALRSGEFTQGFGSLRQQDCFCVLGVLSELHRRQHSQDFEWVDHRFYRSKLSSGLYEVSLHPAVRDWAGILEQEPVIHTLPISSVNDIAREPFDVLSSFIETQL